MRVPLPSREDSRVKRGDKVQVPVDGVLTWLPVVDVNYGNGTRWLVVDVANGVRVGAIVRLERMGR